MDVVLGMRRLAKGHESMDMHNGQTDALETLGYTIERVCKMGTGVAGASARKDRVGRIWSGMHLDGRNLCCKKRGSIASGQNVVSRENTYSQACTA